MFTLLLYLSTIFGFTFPYFFYKAITSEDKGFRYVLLSCFSFGIIVLTFLLPLT